MSDLNKNLTFQDILNMYPDAPIINLDNENLKKEEKKVLYADEDFIIVEVAPPPTLKEG